MSIEAMKQALEALERIDLWLKARYSGIGLVGVELEAITSLRQAIAEAEKQEVSGLKLIHRADIDLTKKIEAEKQEPVAWMDPNDPNRMTAFKWENIGYHNKPVYTSPPQRQPLTFEQVEDCFPEGPSVFEDAYGDNHTSPRWLHAFARAIEAAHGIGEKK